MVAELGSGLTHEEIQAAEGLLRFIDESPSAFHAVSALRARFDEAGFVFLPEAQTWSCKPGGALLHRAQRFEHHSLQGGQCRIGRLSFSDHCFALGFAPVQNQGSARFGRPRFVQTLKR